MGFFFILNLYLKTKIREIKRTNEQGISHSAKPSDCERSVSHSVKPSNSRA
jgi:hypothetical protein